MTRSIFVVEDEPTLRELLARHLRQRGHEVIASADAESALLHLIDAPPFDLLITDVHLPSLSGIDLLRLLQAHSPTRPVLVITGDTDDSIAREVVARGAAGFLLKPFRLAELDAAIDMSLSHVELMERLGERSPAPSMWDFGIPIAWLELADIRSGAGAGHGRRVEHLAGALARHAGLGGADLESAARLHEIGRLVASDRATEPIPVVSARLLEHTAAHPEVVRAVAAMANWDQVGDGSSPLDARAALLIADRIDHAAAEGVRRGQLPPAAVREAVAAVRAEAAQRLGSAGERFVGDAQEVLTAIWILSRG